MATIAKEKEIFSTTCCSEDNELCCVEMAFNAIGGKWGFLILKNLFSGKKRFGELRRLLNDVNAKSLTSSLRSLEEYGLINRKVFATVPATVEYSLTEKGEDLKKILVEMYLWGEKWCKET